MKTWRSFIGWPASLILLISYVLSESACLLIWGNLGGALWVALHFVLMPVLSVVLAVLIILEARSGGVAHRLVLLSSLLIPGLIVQIAASADPGLARFIPHL